MKKAIGIILLLVLLGGTIGFVSVYNHASAAPQTQTVSEEKTGDNCKSCCSMD